MERLDKLIAERTSLSRSEVKKRCSWGRVFVNGECVRDPSKKVDPDADIRLGLERTPVLPLPMFVMYHKPSGVQSTMRDEWGRPCLDTVLPEQWRGKLHPVGRLDAETTGLLLFCKDGTLTQRLLHPRHEMEREYIARVEKKILDPEVLTARLRDGVETSEGIVTGEVVSIDEDTIQLIVKEGKYRMVRRMLANAGHPVEALHRVRYGAFELGELEEGALRALTESEWSWVSTEA